MRSLLVDSALRVRLEAEGPRLMRERFAWSSAAAKYLVLYDEV
jgi:hypothetical protein